MAKRNLLLAASVAAVVGGFACRGVLLTSDRPFETGALHGPCARDGACSEGRCLETRSSRSCEIVCAQGSGCAPGMACAVFTDSDLRVCVERSHFAPPAVRPGQRSVILDD